MSVQVQYRRGTAVENNSFVGAYGEITVDTTNWILRVQDGATAGGFATVGLNTTQTLTNKTYYGSGVGLTSIPAANVTGTLSVNTTGYAATVSTAAQPNITSVGTLSSLTSSGTITASQFTGSGAGLTSVPAANLSGTTLNSGVVTSSLTAVGALNAGSITSGFGAINIGTDAVTCGSIVNANANGVGNIGAVGGYFNTVFAKATSAQYADLAEKYLADAEYPVGTVLVIGGDAEVTQSTSYNQTSVAGTVSENPATIMNAGLRGTTATVALLGRVPCRVVGTIRKGDLLATSDFPGVATSLLIGEAKIGSVIGKALESYNSSEVGVIEIMVGRV